MVDHWEQLTERLPQLDRYFFLTRYAERSYLEPQYQPGDVLVFGSETSGLPQHLHKTFASQCVRIPIAPEARCLNLAVSVGIAAFEAKRQIEKSFHA